MSEQLQKHLRVIGYLALSGLLTYGAARLANRPEYIYATPVVNYILYALTQELKGEGVISEMLKK